MLHAEMIDDYVQSGKENEGCKTQWKLSLFDEFWIPSPHLLAKLDPKRKRGESLLEDLHERVRLYRIYRGQTSTNAAEVRSWSIDKYLDVMESFRVVTRIKSPEETWGDIWFKCSCKYCHIHACCAESILLSMVLNPALKLP